MTTNHTKTIVQQNRETSCTWKTPDNGHCATQHNDIVSIK